MWRASNWARRLYNLTGRYNGKPCGDSGALPAAGLERGATPRRRARAHAAAEAERFPQDLAYTVSLDTTRAVTAGMKEILYTLLEALALVVLVVYIFLQGWRATLIPLLAVPVSLIGTFVVFPLLGFSINTLSLFGLVLAIGLVVDDAIVVVEAVERHIEEGMTPRDAALKAMEEVSGPGHRDRADSDRRVRSDRFHSRHHGPPVSAVRRDDRDLGHLLGIQCAVAQPRAGGAAAEAEGKQIPRAAGALLSTGSTAVFGRVTEGYVSISAVLIRKAVFSLVLLAVIAVIAVLIGEQAADFIPAGGRPGLRLRRPAAAECGFACSARRAAARQVEDDHSAHARRAGLHVRDRLQPAEPRAEHLQRVLLRHRKALGRAQEAGRAICRHPQRTSHGGFRKVPDGMAFSFPPPAIPGVGTSGGVTFMLEDRSGARPAFLTQNVDKFMAAAGKRPELAGVATTYLPNVPQDYRRRGSSQGGAPGREHRATSTRRCRPSWAAIW